MNLFKYIFKSFFSFSLKKRFKNILLIIKNKDVYIHPSADVSLSSCFEGGNKIHRNSTFKGEIGYCSYIGPDSVFKGKIGRFASIAPNCKVYPGIHPYTYPFVSSSPVFFSLSGQCGFSFADRQKFDEFKWADTEARHSVIVGNDVWVQANVTIQTGVVIGDGAVVLSGAIVTKDVPPYAIVGGIPARVIKYRYSEEDINFLLKVKWWNNTPEWFKENWNLLNEISKLKQYYHESDAEKIDV